MIKWCIITIKTNMTEENMSQEFRLKDTDGARIISLKK